MGGVAAAPGTDRKGVGGATFPPGPGLFEALLSMYMGIVTGGTGGDGLRGLYADFLDEGGRGLAGVDRMISAWRASCG
ncbi:MAG: hypothetical protein U5Q44_04695 [Dehalococcoidia bacterium]|nr:hypothetical protein [Dehalococcoidia bacterium]